VIGEQNKRRWRNRSLRQVENAHALPHRPRRACTDVFETIHFARRDSSDARSDFPIMKNLVDILSSRSR
jgi:hypothetical protein